MTNRRRCPVSELIDSDALKAELGDYKFNKLFCWSQAGTAEPDEEFVSHIIESAEDEVKAELHRLYDYTPNGTNVPEAVRAWALNLAIYLVYRARGYEEVGLPYKHRADEYQKLAREGHLGPEWQVGKQVVLAPRRMPPRTTHRLPRINQITDRQYF